MTISHRIVEHRTSTRYFDAMKIRRYLDASPLFGLSIAYDELMAHLDDRLKTEHVHFLQGLIVTALFFEGRPVRPSELSTVLKCSRSNMSHALRDLERQKLIERSVSTDDARAYFFTLTKEGKRKAPRLVKIFDVAQDRLELMGGKALNAHLRRFVRSHCQASTRAF